jgi:hypothetical protein
MLERLGEIARELAECGVLDGFGLPGHTDLKIEARV